MEKSKEISQSRVDAAREEARSPQNRVSRKEARQDYFRRLRRLLQIGFVLSYFAPLGILSLYFHFQFNVTMKENGRLPLDSWGPPTATLSGTPPFMVGLETALASSFAHIFIIGAPNNAIAYAMRKDPETGEQSVTLKDFFVLGF